MSTPPNKPYTKFSFDTEFFEVVGGGTPSASTNGGKAAGRGLEEARQEGYADGYGVGVAEGRKQAEQGLAALRETLHNTLDELQKTVSVREEQLTIQTLSLVRLTLHHVLGHAAQYYPDELLEHHLKAVLPQVKADESLILRINPIAQGYHEKLNLPQASILGLPMQIVTDASCAPTDVSIEWRGGGVESKLAVHWEAINTLLLGAGASPLPVPPLPDAQTATPAPVEPHVQASAPVDPIKARAAELLGDDELIDALK